MCRHLAYLGPPVSLRSVIMDPPVGLYRQSWAARRQQFGTVNADGFGVGWYAPGDPVPARYRRALPVWADESFADVARVTISGAMLAAGRSASAGTELSEASGALVLHRLRLGMAAAEALRDTIGALDSAGVTGRFNFLLTDGERIAASSAGDTLCYRQAAGAVVVASEPADDEPGWQDVPSGSVLSADTSGVTLSVGNGVTLG